MMMGERRDVAGIGGVSRTPPAQWGAPDQRSHEDGGSECCSMSTCQNDEHYPPPKVLAWCGPPELQATSEKSR